MQDMLYLVDLAPAGSAFTLNAAIALLVELAGEDVAELRRVQSGLEDLAFEGGLVPTAQALVAGAARRIREALDVEGDQRRSGLADARALLEQAGSALPGVTLFEAPAATATGGTQASPLDGTDAWLLADFIAESQEHLQGAEAALLELETDPDDEEAVNTVFRAFHTIKGTSAFLGLEPVTELAHHAESLFTRFRDSELRCTGPGADLSLRAVDMLAALLAAVETSTRAGEPCRLPDGYADLVRTLENPDAGLLDAEEESPAEPAPGVPGAPALPPRLGDILVALGKADRRQIESVAAKNDGPIGIALVREKVVSLTDVVQALRAQQRGGAPAQSGSSVRVRSERLDGLIHMLNELALVQSLVTQEALTADPDCELARRAVHAEEIVRDLRDLGLSLRVVSMKSTFQRMARLVRDVARKTGKLVRFTSAGEETVIDRSVLEAIADPLVHMIRNAVDHGIEARAVREANGKTSFGSVRLEARHADGEVIVELRDDGKGLDRDRILQKAIANDIVGSGEGLSDAEIFNLIFAPGFTTTDQVTDFSGRGVGMDVVKRNVEMLGGRVDIESRPGEGSTFSIRLPRSAAASWTGGRRS
ncbi:MAG: Hpt domain-containing protein [Gemmatimonadetes bacterium]|nr:Hpt domain-containing protein [Gemmatimonadota bacterium]